MRRHLVLSAHRRALTAGAATGRYVPAVEQRHGTPRQRTAGRGAGRGKTDCFNTTEPFCTSKRPIHGTCNRDRRRWSVRARRLHRFLSNRRRRPTPVGRWLAEHGVTAPPCVEIPPAQRPMRGTRSKTPKRRAALPAPQRLRTSRARLRRWATQVGDRGVFGAATWPLTAATMSPRRQVRPRPSPCLIYPVHYGRYRRKMPTKGRFDHLLGTRARTGRRTRREWIRWQNRSYVTASTRPHLLAGGRRRAVSVSAGPTAFLFYAALKRPWSYRPRLAHLPQRPATAAHSTPPISTVHSGAPTFSTAGHACTRRSETNF